MASLIECENKARDAIDEAFDLPDKDWQAFLTTVQEYMDDKIDERG